MDISETAPGAPTSRYPLDKQVRIAPFQRQLDGGEIIISRPEIASFVALPPEAVELLDLLADGKTIEEAEELYKDKYGDSPATEDLLLELEARGFVSPSSGAQGAPAAADAAEGEKPRDQYIPIRYHFAGFPQALARVLFGRAALCAHGAIIALSAAALWVEPNLLPSLMAVVPSRHFSTAFAVFMALRFLTIFIHEMAHLVAARAAGVSSRLGIGHRLWIVVAETDMTGVWAVPRRDRFVPILAGPLVDLTSAALVVLTLFAAARRWIELSAFSYSVCRMLLLIYLLRILWQLHLFVRTDFYYVLSNLFGCKNLMSDTEAWLLYRVKKPFGWWRGPAPLSDVPARERRVIRAYSVLWLLGRALAFTVLFAVQIPLLYRFFARAYRTVTSPASSAYDVADVLILCSFAALSLVVGLTLWARSLVQGTSVLRRAS